MKNFKKHKESDWKVSDPTRIKKRPRKSLGLSTTVGNNSNRVLLIIKGRANCGKSTTIKLAYEMVLKELLLGIGAPIRPHIKYCDPLRNEIAAQIRIKGFRSLGMATRGDNSTLVMEGLNFFTHTCQIIVCATRTRGSSITAARNFANQHGYQRTEILRQPTAMAALQQSQNHALALGIRNWVLNHI